MLKRSLRLIPLYSFTSSKIVQSLSALKSNSFSSSISQSKSLFSQPKFMFSSISINSELPFHTELTMPALSPTMKQVFLIKKGNIMTWFKKEGDLVKAGDSICDVETDKANVGFEVQEEGYLAKILIPEGSKDVNVGEVYILNQPICIIVSSKNEIAAFANYKKNSNAPNTTENTQNSVPNSNSNHENSSKPLSNVNPISS